MFINCNQIKFSYSKDKKVLNNISFSLAKGKTLAIVGASGCGKSTLLRILSGILPNAKGNSLQGEISIGGLTPDQYRQTGKLAFMFQEATLMPHLTVKQNIKLPLKIKGQSNEQKISDLIKAVGLTEYADYLPKQLSGGMKTRVALTRSFSTNPELLLLDEPFSALDIAWKSKLYIELEKLKEQHKTTVVIVTHDVQEALLLTDKVIVFGKSGIIINEETIPISDSILDRVTNIAEYNDRDVFRKLFSSIQKWILNDSVHDITSEKEVELIAEQIKNVAGNESLERKFNDIFVSMYGNTNNEKVNLLLFESFKKGTPYLKNELIWDILTYEKIDDEKIAVILNYYYDNISDVSTQARDSYYKLESDKIFDKIFSRINTDIYLKNKSIFLLGMYASSETERVLNYLEEVMNGKIEQLNYPLAKEVAQKVAAKMKNEKQDTI
ncbi:MAG: ATP-binding cassette domain-containing protein, partial [Ignavibacteriae bacterium]|nr:ATP-binding cassette domain-containing protein [Ignavibacteriota bacterium]